MIVLVFSPGTLRQAPDSDAFFARSR